MVETILSPESVIDRLIRQDGAHPLRLERLKGDGSERLIFRARFARGSAVAVYHENVPENQRFVELARRLRRTGVKVPRLGAVADNWIAYLQEDLGDETLALAIERWNAEGNNARSQAAYRRLLPILANLHRRGGEVCADLLKPEPMNRSLYEQDLSYFRREFLERFGLLADFGAEHRRETAALLERVATVASTGFVSRDFQSRNIMARDGDYYIIDFQGAMFGPPEYDLASLLYAGKAGLTEDERDPLLRAAYANDENRTESFEAFCARLYDFVVLRRLRSFGTYGFLGHGKGKADFLDLITPSCQQFSELTRRRQPRRFRALADFFLRLSTDTNFLEPWRSP